MRPTTAAAPTEKQLTEWRRQEQKGPQTVTATERHTSKNNPTGNNTLTEQDNKETNQIQQKEQEWNQTDRQEKKTTNKPMGIIITPHGEAKQTSSKQGTVKTDVIRLRLPLRARSTKEKEKEESSKRQQPETKKIQMENTRKDTNRHGEKETSRKHRDNKPRQAKGTHPSNKIRKEHQHRHPTRNRT